MLFSQLNDVKSTVDNRKWFHHSKRKIMASLAAAKTTKANKFINIEQRRKRKTNLFTEAA